MGSIVSASYPCGFEEEGLALGGGMRDFATRCSLPALCTDCGAFQVANSKAKRPRCSWCQGSLRFYTDPALYTERAEDAEDDEYGIFYEHRDDGDIRLPHAFYQCPRCGEKTMQFAAIGPWD